MESLIVCQKWWENLKSLSGDEKGKTLRWGEKDGRRPERSSRNHNLISDLKFMIHCIFN